MKRRWECTQRNMLCLEIEFGTFSAWHCSDCHTDRFSNLRKGNAHTPVHAHTDGHAHVQSGLPRLHKHARMHDSLQVHTGGAKHSVNQHGVHGRLGLLHGRSHHHALARCQPVSLHHDGRPVAADEGLCCLRA